MLDGFRLRGRTALENIRSAFYRGAAPRSGCPCHTVPKAFMAVAGRRTSTHEHHATHTGGQQNVARAGGHLWQSASCAWGAHGTAAHEAARGRASSPACTCSQHHASSTRPATESPATAWPWHVGAECQTHASAPQGAHVMPDRFAERCTCDDLADDGNYDSVSSAITRE